MYRSRYHSELESGHPLRLAEKTIAATIASQQGRSAQLTEPTVQKLLAIWCENDEFCIKNEEFVSKTRNVVFKTRRFVLK